MQYGRMRITERDAPASGRTVQVPASKSEGGVARVGAVLGAFRDGAECRTLGQLSEITGLPKATTHRYLRQLLAIGLLDRTPDNLYFIGARLWEIGQLARSVPELGNLALPFLCRLFATTGLTVHLAMLDGADVLYVVKLPGMEGPPIRTRVGGRMPAYCTALGKALLAFSAPRVMEDVVANGLARRAPRTIVVPEALEQQMQTVRRSGIAFEHDESAPGVCCVASVVLGPSQEPLAAISVASWGSRLATARLAATVQATAAQISHKLTEESHTQLPPSST